MFIGITQIPAYPFYGIIGFMDRGSFHSYRIFINSSKSIGNDLCLCMNFSHAIYSECTTQQNLYESI